MADEPAKTPIQNKYAQQYADDLAANRKEQGDLTAQITDLKERLEQLRLEETWLTQAQDNLPGADAPGELRSEPAAEVPSAAKDEEPKTSAPAEAVADASPILPQPRKDESVTAEQEQPERPAKKAAGKRTTGRKSSAKKTTAKKTTAKKTAAKKAAIAEAPGEEAADEEKSGPPLWQLVLDTLLKTPGQPCVAREVHDQFTREHPGRATSVQSVRNNLETLVKKGLAEKSRQQGNAMYTANAGADAAPMGDGTVGGAAEQADETAAGKVPAEV